MIIMKDPFSIIAGKSFNYVEYGKFTEQRWEELLNFFLFFLKPDDIKGRFDCSEERIRQMEEIGSFKDSPFKEFLYRLDKWSDNATSDAFDKKLSSFFLNALTFLKKNPSFISQRIKNIIDLFPVKMGWCLKQYNVEKSGSGEIVTRNVDTQEKPTTLPSVQQKMYNSYIKLADFVEQLSGTFDIKEAKRLDLMDKIKIFKELTPFFSLAAKRVQNNSFTTINLNTGDVKSAEKALLDYLSKKT